jgi:polygalacturonase
MPEENGKDTLCFNVRDYGAMGDSTTTDTLPIQRAIDACARAGGGVVALHNGVFLVGSLELRSYVDLDLSPTAVLLGTPDVSAYHLDEKTPYRLIGRSLI